MLVSNVFVSPEFSTSDHKIVKFDIDLKMYEKNSIEEMIYVYSERDYDKLELTLSETGDKYRVVLISMNHGQNSPIS